MTKNRICLFTSSLNRGGAERVFVNLANYWSREGHEVDFVVFSDEGGLKDELEPQVKLVVLKSGSVLPARIKTALLFAAYLKERSPDRVYATLTYVCICGLIAKRLSGYSGKLILRQANALCNQSTNSLGARLINAIAYRFWFQSADVIIVNSRVNREELIEAYPKLATQVRLIHNPVRIPSQCDSVSENKDLRSPIILGSGRMSEQKDFATLIRAFALVAKKVDARLVLLGDGALRQKLESLVADLSLSERVTFAGYTSDPEAYYLRASMFVLTSRWEGFPNVVVESLSYGLPVVVTDCIGASREIVEPILPENVVPVGDFEQVAERIIATLKHTVEPTKIVASVRERFGLEQIAAEYLNL